MSVSIVPIENKFRVKSFMVGAVSVACLLQPDDLETADEANEKLRLIKLNRKHYETKINPAMDLVTTIGKAQARSKQLKKLVFIELDGEGECEVVLKQTPQCTHAFSNGAEVPLPNLEQETKKEVTPKTKVKMEKVVKTAAKKSPVKKSAAPAKKVAAKKILKPAIQEEIKGNTVKEAITAAKKAGVTKGVANVKGKSYAFRIASTWSVMKSVVDNAKDGMIMATGEGTYLYPKADFKKIFGNIFASNSYKNNGAYAQSKVPSQYTEGYLVK